MDSMDNFRERFEALEPVWKVSSSKSFEHQPCHCHIYKRLTCGW